MLLKLLRLELLWPPLHLLYTPFQVKVSCLDKYVKRKIPFLSLARQEVGEGIEDVLLQLAVVKAVVLVAPVEVVVRIFVPLILHLVMVEVMAILGGLEATQGGLVIQEVIQSLTQLAIRTEVLEMMMILEMMMTILKMRASS